MTRPDPECVDAITLAVVARGGRLEGEEYRFPCCEPTHHRNGDVHPSARWNPIKAVWRCDVRGIGGGAVDLARRLRLELPDARSRRASLSAQPSSLDTFAAERGIPLAVLRRFRVEATMHKGRPALRYPTTLGIDRIKYTDGIKPKYRWAATGGRVHWYGLPSALKCVARVGGALYTVNGEPSVWACSAADVAAVCLCGGEGSSLNDTLISELRAATIKAGLSAVPLRVVYDTDRPGRKGARAAVATVREAGWNDVIALDLAPILPDVAGGDVDDLHQRVGDDLAAALAALPVLGEEEEAADGPSEGVGLLLADVQPERVSWLWPGRIPRGKVTLLEGDPDEGKSTLAISLSARVTTGDAMPFTPGTSTPAGVIFLTAEDGLGDTVRPRFEAAGADLGRVVVFQPEELPTIGDEHGLDRIETAITRIGAALVVIDPLMAFLADRVESYKDHHIRRALAPLAALAQRTGAAVLVIRHLNKSGGTNAKHRGGGSIGILGAARSALLAAPDPDDPDRKVLARVKGNLGPPVPAVAYCLVAEAESVRVEWIEETGHTANALLAAALETERPDKLEAATDFLVRFLSAGRRVANDVKAAATRQGIALKTLRRACERLGVRAHKDSFSGPWHWALPAEDAQGGQDAHIQSDGHLRTEWAPSARTVEEGDAT